MTSKEFMNLVTRSKNDPIRELLYLLKKSRIGFCVIGGLAVNAYCEPVVSLDIDLVIVRESLDNFIELAKKYFKIKIFPQNINLSSKNSNIRIQIQTDERYQAFIPHFVTKTVLGYRQKLCWNTG